MKKIILYDYQQEMLENITKALTGRAQVAFYDQNGKKMKVGNSVMVQMPTGTGKTYVMAAVVKWFLEKYEKGEVWLIAHRKELVEQMQQTLDRFCLEYAEKEEELKEKVRIRVLSIQWLSRHIGEMEAKGCKPGFIVVDEAHHALADSYQDVFDRNRPALKMGMTATPCRMKKESFGGLFTRLLISPSTADFILRGYLAPYSYVVIGKFSPDQQIVDLLKGRGSDGDYAVKEMDEKLNIPQAIQRLYDSVRKYADGKKGIVYAIDIAHAKAIADCYNSLGMKAVALDSKTPAKMRAQMVEAFKKGELDCLVNVNLFDEGFDCPDVEYIQMARPTLSLAKYLQMVGRGLRINKEDPKKVCVIIDNVGNYRKFGYPDKPRRWASMFAGVMAGKGILSPTMKRVSGVVVMEEDMVMVKTVSTERKRMTDQELKMFKKNVKPFLQEDTMRMGLKSGNEIVLRPIYPYISPFRGDHAIFRLNNHNYLYGVLDRLGYIVVAPEYQSLDFLNAHTLVGRKPHSDSESINL